MSRLRLENTGRFAHVAIGEWDGERYALDGDYPVVKLSNGQFAVLLEAETKLPPRCESEEMSAAKKNGGPR